MWSARAIGCLALRRGVMVGERNSSSFSPSFLFSTTSTTTLLGGGVRFSSPSPVHFDQRKKKKQKQHNLFEGKQRSSKVQRCLGYRTAEEYDFSRVQGVLSSHQMSPTILEDDEVIHARLPVEEHGEYPSFGKNVFFFREHGSIVCWGTTSEEESSIVRLLRQCEQQPLMHNITEQMDCFLHEQTSRVEINSGGIYLEGTQLESDLIQQQLAFSYAIVASLELEQRELDLEELLEKIEPYFQDIVRKPPSGRQIQDIMAQEILLRGKINLHSSILDTPETYWDRHDLESLYEKTRDSLDVTRRVSKLNATLQHLHQMVEVLKHDRQESVSNKLELWIIALICIEIFCALLEKSENWRHFRWEHLFSDPPPKRDRSER